MDIEHVKQVGEVGWGDPYVTGQKIIVESVQGGSILQPQIVQCGHEEGFMLGLVEVQGLPMLIIL